MLLPFFVLLLIMGTTGSGLDAAFSDRASPVDTGAGRLVGSAMVARDLIDSRDARGVGTAAVAEGNSARFIDQIAAATSPALVATAESGNSPAIAGTSADPNAEVEASLGNTPANSTELESGTTSESEQASALPAQPGPSATPAAPSTPANPPALVSTPTIAAEPGTTTRPTQPPTTVTPPTTVAPKTTVTVPKTTTTSTTTTSTTTTSTTPVPLSTVRVSTSGNDSNSGVPGSPVATLSRALDLVATGGTVQFEAGTYEPLRLVGLNGVKLVGGSGVTFQGSDYTGEAGILIQDSSNIDISGMTINRALWGIYVSDSHNVTLRSNTISDIGQEAIRLKDGSSNILISDNTISDTGRRSSDANGEGIYIGTGSPGGVDHVSNVTIEGNRITRTTDEAIDIKTPASNIVVRSNTITDIVTQTTGAVVVHINSTSSDDPNITIESNTITNVSRSSEFRDGNCIVSHVTASIVNNSISNCEHRGIHLAGADGEATVTGNTLTNAGSVGAIVDEGRGMSVLMENNTGG